MKTLQYTITDPLGIHARPAGLLVKESNKFTSSITIKKGDKTADCKKIFALMALAIKVGESIEIMIDGSDEDEASLAMESFFKQNL